MKYEEEIRKVIELQKQVRELQAEVSRILGQITDPANARTGIKFVVDGVLWEVDRWPLDGAPTREHFSAWRLKNQGKVML